MKTAVIHDWLTGMRGGEKVLEAILELFPNADLYTMVYKKGSVSKIISDRNIRTSFINKLPFSDKLYKHYNPLFPFAVEQFDLSSYDLVISSSHAAAKGVLTGPDTIHISYIHTPIRYYWDRYNEYFNEYNPLMKLIIASVSTFYRTWDVSNTNRIDHLIANSQFVARRIKKYYNRNSDIIYPPVATERFKRIYQKKQSYYVITSALVPYKRIDVAIKAFNKNGKKLKIIGGGYWENKLKDLAKPNIEFLGKVSDSKMDNIYSNAKAFILNSVEDFGISVVEAQAAGLPVIAYGRGAAIEIVRNDETGVFYESQNEDSLNEAIEKLEKIKWSKDRIKKNSERFSKEAFISSFGQKVNSILNNCPPSTYNNDEIYISTKEEHIMKEISKKGHTAS